ncbi:helix-turn-helix domain-containing protein [Streptomyces pacificus]|uniref:HTH araC/xylS-type domain-containing protein n=1 Tax=Streptomyces pacificus TaxID=2705029 RepID=A0A6A0AY94_9ACTN|nr:helix-turn-helix domain-containing protein [Streptomyces pacificus]GFH37920.1 hypothetical protein SCWH03_41600 [Streptomyces pacificus]
MPVLTNPSLARTPIQAIAHRWGFNSRAHITRAYTAHYGHTPRHTRRRRLDQQRPKT